MNEGPSDEPSRLTDQPNARILRLLLSAAPPDVSDAEREALETVSRLPAGVVLKTLRVITAGPWPAERAKGAVVGADAPNKKARQVGPLRCVSERHGWMCYLDNDEEQDFPIGGAWRGPEGAEAFARAVLERFDADWRARALIPPALSPAAALECLQKQRGELQRYRDRAAGHVLHVRYVEGGHLWVYWPPEGCRCVDCGTITDGSNNLETCPGPSKDTG